jgi:hypothetical protein
MAAYPWRAVKPMKARLAAAHAVGSVVLVLAGACASEQPGDDQPEQSTQSSAPVNTKKCLKHQRYGTWPAGPRLQALTQRVLSNADEQASAAAVERFARAIGSAARRASKVCGDEATELAAVAELAGSAVDAGPDEALLRQIVDAFEEWGQTIGRVRETRILYVADPCVPMREHVHASYEIGRRPESGGVAVWVEVVLVNDWTEQVYLDHGGRIEATGVRPDGGTRIYDWGGSSSDTSGAAPGRTSRDRVYPVPATGPEPYLHLFPEGDVRVFDVHGSAYGRVGPCAIDVEPTD